MGDSATVSRRGALRWERGHPWIFRSDVTHRPAVTAGGVRVRDERGRWLGIALWSPASEISLRLLDTNADAQLDDLWWAARLRRAVDRRAPIGAVSNACRLIHAEGDALPSLVCDRYDRWLVLQVLSAGLEAYRDPIVNALVGLTNAEGVLARNDVPLRSREGLARETTVLHGDVPQVLEVQEYGVRMRVAPWTGQKTGAFLDQRESRHRMGELAGGRALDCFCYHGSFSLHMAGRAERVTAIDSSSDAVTRAIENARLNGLANVEVIEENAFDYLRAADRAGARFDTIILDPPAFAKTRDTVERALRGYHEINLRAMRILEPGGLLYTASCSYHVTKPLFLEMVDRAAADTGRRIQLRELITQPIDHPEILTIPETGYLKGAIVEARD
jgi:23S rRNA (cytosine1962-C5)-methyltransferase